MNDFIYESIAAASVADVALIVVDPTIRKHISEKVLIPTKNAAYLARSIGINNVVVFISKTDSVRSTQEKIIDTEGNIKTMLKQIGFKDESVKFLKGSSFEKNISASIFDTVLQFSKTGNDELKPLRFLIDDCYRLVHGKLLGFCITGYIISGIISVGQRISIGQADLQGKVKEIMKSGEKVKKSMAGDWIDVTLTEIEGDFSSIRRGFVACTLEYPISLSIRLRIRGITNDLAIPLLKKQELIMCIGNIRTVITIIKILREIVGGVAKNKPRGLKWKTIGDIDILCHKPIPVEKYKNLPKLGRCLLLDKGKIVFAGMITDILE